MGTADSDAQVSLEANVEGKGTLVSAAPNESDEQASLLNNGAHKQETPATVGQETRRVLRLAAPISLSEILSFLSYLITTSQVGSLGAAALSSFTLARTLYHITGLSLVAGLASGQDTFSGQAFGARQYRMVGVYMQRSASITCLVALAAMCAWWWKAEALMALLHQDKDLIPTAATCLRWMAPALLISSVQVAAHNYFSSQGVVVPLAVVAASGVVVTPAVNHLFIYTLGHGVQGAAMAYTVVDSLGLLALLCCMVWLHYRQPQGAKTWGGFAPREALGSWLPYLRIALPSMAMICLDWWCFEVMVLVAGLQPNAAVQLGAMGVMFGTHALAFMVAAGFGGAVATRVANELGAGRGQAAQRATFVCAALCACTMAVVAVLLVVCRKPWAALYSSDVQVQDAVAGAMSLLAVSVAFDSLNTVFSGVLRGAGHQLIGFLVNLSTFWAIGIPLAYTLDIKHGLGARGVWMSLAGVSALQASVLLTVVSSFSWRKLADRAQALLAAGQQPVLAEELAAPPGHHAIYEPLIGAAHV